MARIIGRVTSGAHGTEISAIKSKSQLNDHPPLDSELSQTADESGEALLQRGDGLLTIPSKHDRSSAGFARFPRPRSRLLSSGVGNFLGHLQTLPAKKTLALKPNTESYVASADSPVLNSDRIGHTAALALPPVSQLTLIKDTPLQTTTRDFDHDSALHTDSISTSSSASHLDSPALPPLPASGESSDSLYTTPVTGLFPSPANSIEEQEVLSLLDSMLPSPSSTEAKQRNGSAQFDHRRNQSESQLPGLYQHSSRSVRDIATVFEAAKSSSSTNDLPGGFASGTTSPLFAKPQSPSLDVPPSRQGHSGQSRYKVYPMQNQSLESLASSAQTSPNASVFSPGLSSNGGWLQSPATPYPDSFSDQSQAFPGQLEAPQSSEQPQAEYRLGCSRVQDSTVRPHPGRMMTDWTMATSVSGEEDDNGDIAVAKLDNSPHKSISPPPPASPSKAKALIDLFEKNNTASAGKMDDPVVHCRVSSEELSKLPTRPRLIRAGDHLESWTPAQSSLANTIRPSTPQQSPVSLSTAPASAPRMPSPEPDKPVQHHTPSKAADDTTDPAIAAETGHAGEAQTLTRSSSPRFRASPKLPLSDLVPITSASSPKILTVRKQPQHTRSISPHATSSSSLRRSRESGHLPLSTEGATAMLDTASEKSALQAGRVWYYAVAPSPRLTAQWVRAQAVLFPDALALSWIPQGGGRENIVLELDKCQSVHSLPSVEHSASIEDQGAQKAKSQGLASIKPLQFVFEDGVERLALDSIKERSSWVLAARNALSGRTVSPSALRSEDHELAQLERIGGAWSVEPSASQSRQTGEVSRDIGQDLFAGGPPVPPKPGSGSQRASTPPMPREIPTGQPVHVSTAGGRVHSMKPSIDEITPSVGIEPTVLHLAGGADDDGEAQADETARAFRRGSVSEHVHRKPVPEVSSRRISGSDFTFGGHELFPSDSASQRPPQSDAEERIELPEQLYTLRSPGRNLFSVGDLIPAASSPVRMSGALAVPPASPSPKSGARTPAQIFRDQVMSSSGARTDDEVREQLESALSTHRLGTVLEETRSQAIAAGGSAQRSTPQSEVHKVLSYLEKETTSRASRDKQLEEQLIVLQEAVSALSSKRSVSRRLENEARGLSANDPTSRQSLRSDASFEEIQGKLDQVLKMVKHASGNRALDDEARSMTQTELGRIGKGVDELLNRVKSRKVSQATHPSRPDSQADTVYADAPDRRSNVASTTTYATPTPRKAWNSTEAVNAAPPPSIKGSATSVRHSREPSIIQRNIDVFEPPAAWHDEASRPASPSKKSEATLDMEAAVRQRRAEQFAGVRTEYPDSSKGGWYSPKRPASIHQRDGVSNLGTQNRDGAKSTLAHMPTPQWVPVNPEEEPPQVKAATVGTRDTPSADPSLTKIAAEMTSALSSWKENEESRKVQQQQQSDIAGYLNDLNKWLHKDVEERGTNLKALSEGVSKLIEEVTALKAATAIDKAVSTPKSQRSKTLSDKSQPSAPRDASLPMADGAGQDTNVQPGNWPFQRPSVAHGADPEKPTLTPQVHDAVDEEAEKARRSELSAAEEEARKYVLDAAEDELARHLASMERIGQDPPIDGGTAVLSAKSESELGEAANKKNVRFIRKLVRESAAIGAGASALKFLKDHFHKERSREEGESQLPIRPSDAPVSQAAPTEVPPKPTSVLNEAVAPVAEVQTEKKEKSKKTKDFSAHPAHGLLETALNAAKEGKLSEALTALKEGHLKDAYHVMQGVSHHSDTDADPDSSTDSTASGSKKHSLFSSKLKHGLMGTASGVVLAFAIEEMMKHLHEKKEEEKMSKMEQEKREIERELARVEADKARDEKLLEMQSQHSAAIINALNEVMQQERIARETAAAAKSQELDPKTAIEALVQALNNTRIEEAQKRAQSDAAIATLATEVIRQTNSQHQHLLETLAGMSKDLVKNGIDHHLDHFKGAMAASFAGSAQAMADAWTSHAKQASAAAANGPKAIEPPQPAQVVIAPAPAPAPVPASPAGIQDQGHRPNPPPRRNGPRNGPSRGRTGPYGVPVN
ncbi:unnamed protein product [Sympodiomycopsis kandeliae]